MSGFEQTLPEKVFTLEGIGIPDWKLWVNCQPFGDSKTEILADVGDLLFPDRLVRFPSRGMESGQGFCRFPGLDSTEAERLSGESRPPLLLGLSNGVLLNLHNVKGKKENQMNQSTTDEIKGNIHEAKGTVKEKAGQVTNNPNLTAEGRNEKFAGKVEKKVGQIEKVFEK